MATNTVFSEASFILGNNPPYKAGNVAARQDDGSLVEFTVARSTTATRVAPSGFIESVAANVPRIDYLNGGCGELLVEPQRTNLITNSNGFSGTNFVANNQTSPDGTTNAGTATFSVAGPTNTDKVDIPNFSVTTGVTYQVTVYAKFISGTGDGSFNIRVDASGIKTSSTFTPSGNWQRFTFEFTADATTTTANSRIIAGPGCAAGDQIAIFGIMAEEGSYATSYIPTVASTVTRNADVISLGSASALLGDSEGALFVEAAPFTDDEVMYLLSLSKTNSFNDSVNITFRNTAQIQYLVQVGTTQVVSSIAGSYIPNVFTKLAARYAVNNFALYSDGSSIITDTSGSTFNDGDLVNVKFSTPTDISPFYGRIRQLIVFDEALFDEELSSIAAYASFTEIANANNYTING